MARIKRATIVLPLIVLLLGAVVPAVFMRDEAGRASDAEETADRVAGRTAGEWERLAGEALVKGRYRKAISYIKTAERAEPGDQYGAELRGIRTAMRGASEARRARDRFAGGPPHVDFTAAGEVRSGHRLVTVLPGESLWSLARGFAAAEHEVTPTDVSQEDIYAVWDRLTELNGVRELEVGERVRMPLPEEEAAVLAEVNARDLERIEAASSALASGDLDDAAALRGAFESSFAGTTVAWRSFDAQLSSALDTRAAERDLDREYELMGGVRDVLAGVPRMSRSREHARRLDSLITARDALEEAEGLRAGSQYVGAAELIAEMLAEETRFAILSDGAVEIRKSPGVSYTEAVLQAVEWVLERELSRSGLEYPYSSGKTDDERAWASYLAAAERVSSERGEDFARLLEGVDKRLELTLPSPVSFFAD